ncbi:MAG TPA: biliverdin-producing heme oxygenase [Microthrixaceae bacterium]|nr:biliverdin-producing heme oxygenase [Microthrixaceae bacterium]
MTQTDESVIVPTRFSEQIREATWTDHGKAEHATFMDELTGGRLSQYEYAELVVQMWFVYQALEASAAALSDDVAVAPFLDPALVRVPALEADLEFLLGEEWRSDASPTPETEAYVARLKEVASWPGGLLAHHYTRYMGDLSGGLFIGRLVSRLYELGPDSGAAFYDFAGITDAKAFKEAYREHLDAVPFDSEEKLRVIEEIHAAYAFNTALLVGLGSRVKPKE